MDAIKKMLVGITLILIGILLVLIADGSAVLLVAGIAAAVLGCVVVFRGYAA